jgi:integrase/recombinase XerD
MSVSRHSGCKRFAAFLDRSPAPASADDIRRFQLDLAGSGLTICNRNGVVAGVKFLFRVTTWRPSSIRSTSHARSRR